jgi:hypothetical protein
VSVAPSDEGIRSGFEENSSNGPADFALVLGGPLYQLWRCTRLAGEKLQLVRRRAIALALLAWTPLLALSVAEGHAWGASVKLSFLHDVELHVRLLLALPLLTVAELGSVQVADRTAACRDHTAASRAAVAHNDFPATVG